MCPLLGCAFTCLHKALQDYLPRPAANPTPDGRLQPWDRSTLGAAAHTEETRLADETWLESHLESHPGWRTHRISVVCPATKMLGF